MHPSIRRLPQSCPVSRVLAAVFVLPLLLGASPPAAPQTTHHSGHKPATHRPPVKPTGPGVKGTAQMAGDNGKMGVTYTIGKGNDAVNFTLLSADYEPSRIVLKDHSYLPGADEKYLVLHFTLQNPNHDVLAVSGGILTYTAVDSHDVNHNYTGASTLLFVKEGEYDSLDMGLKPGQKVAVKTAIAIPANASVPKLIVQQRDVQPVLRIYFKPGEVKPVPAPWNDPNDKTGSVAVKDAIVGTGVYAPLGLFDAKLVSTTYSATARGSAADEGKQFFVATVTIRNATVDPQHIEASPLYTSVTLDDGGSTELWRNDMLRAHQDDLVETTLDPGAEFTFRVAIAIPAGAKVKQFRLSEHEARHTIRFTVD